MHYEKQGDDYYFVRGDEAPRLIGPSVAIMFDSNNNDGDAMMTVLSHGDPGFVHQKFARTVNKYNENGLADIAESLRVVEGEFKVEELNRLIDTSGYMKRFLDQHDIALANIKTGETTMEPWEELMENDSTMQAHVARWETGAATSSDLILMAGDSITNGNFGDAADYIIDAAGDERNYQTLLGLADKAFEASGVDSSRRDGIMAAVGSKLDAKIEEMDGESPRM